MLIRSGSQTRAGDPQGQSVHKVGREALANFISPITLWLGNRGLIRSGSQTRAGNPQSERRGVSAGCRFQDPRQLYFTDHTLAGQPEAYSFRKSDAGRRPGGRAVSRRCPS